MIKVSREKNINLGFNIDSIEIQETDFYTSNGMRIIIMPQTTSSTANTVLTSIQKNYYIGLVDDEDILVVGRIDVHGATSPIRGPLTSVSLDYWIDSNFRKNKITSQVLPLVIEDIFTGQEYANLNPIIDIADIGLEINSDNIGSIKVAEKNGFRKKANINNFYYTLNKKEYLETKNLEQKSLT